MSFSQKQSLLAHQQLFSSKRWEKLPATFFERNAVEVAPDLLGKLFCVFAPCPELSAEKVVHVEKASKKRCSQQSGLDETANISLAAVNKSLSSQEDSSLAELKDGGTTEDLNSSCLVVRIVEVEAYRAEDPASHSSKGLTPRTAVLFGPPGFAYIYGIHGHLNINFVCETKGSAGGVLIRAVEPVLGLDRMRAFRQAKTDIDLTNGPGKLCDALGIERADYGRSLQGPRFYVLNDGVSPADIVATTRIGIKVATDYLWRFVVGSSPYLSISLKSKSKKRPKTAE